MKSLKLDFLNKKVINEFIDGKERVLQQIRLAVQVWKKDWMLDDDFGIDYDEAWGNMLTMGSHIKIQILQVPGVSSIQSFDIRMDTSDQNNIMYIVNANIVYNNEIIKISDEAI